MSTIPVKGSPVWVKLRGRHYLKYSTGQVTNQGKLITSNLKGLQHTIAESFQVAPTLVFIKGPCKGSVTVPLYRPSWRNLDIVDAMFINPVKTLTKNHIQVTEGYANHTPDFIMLLPKSLPVCLANL